MRRLTAKDLQKALSLHQAAIAHKRWNALGKVQRREEMAKLRAGMSARQQSAIARKALATRQRNHQ